MTDIGDWLVPTLTVGTFDGTTSAALTITAPDGTVTNGTGEATSNGGGSWTADAVQLTAAGMWVMTWTVSGTGKGVEHHYVSVLPAPSGVAAPTGTLATIADLLYRVPDLTDAQLARAPAMLADASAKIRRYTRQHITLVANDVVKLRPVGAEIRLPQRPVVSVSSVVAVGWAGMTDFTMPVGTWGFDGIDIITLQPLNNWIINLPVPDRYDDGPNTYRVTYSHGETTSPADVVAVCCDMVLRTLLSPTLVEGMTSERIGEYSYQLGQYQGGGSTGAAVRLSEQDKEALRGYRRTATTVQMRS